MIYKLFILLYSMTKIVKTLFFCLNCDKVYKNTNSLGNHNRIFHQNQKPIEEDNHKFKCEFCNRNYSSMSSLCNHNKKFHITKPPIINHNLLDLQIVNNTQTYEKQFTCEFCNKVFKHRSSKSKHKKICKEKNNKEKQKQEEKIKQEEEFNKEEKIKQEEDFKQEQKKINKELQIIKQEKQKAYIEQQKFKLEEQKIKQQNQEEEDDKPQENQYKCKNCKCRSCNIILYLSNLQRNSMKRLMLNSITFEKKKKSIEYLGCSIEQFKEFIDKKMTPSMNWNNIHLDHIKPISIFNLNDEEEFLKCCHYTNFQPLLAKDNLSKSSKWNAENESFWKENIYGNSEFLEIYNI